jgi:hypothetical protein
MRCGSLFSSLACFIVMLVVQGRVFAADSLDDLIRDRIKTSPPDRQRAQVYANGAVLVGDLFKIRARIAIGVSTAAGEIKSFACFVHRNGDWQEIFRQTLGTTEAPHHYRDEWPCTLTDLDGDGAPELLLSESGGGDERVVSVWRFNAEQQTLTNVGSGLRNPTFSNGVVRGTWKLGPTRGDVGAEEHTWIDGRLVRNWSSEQRYHFHEYLIGSGEPAVRIEQTILSATGAETKATAIGNLASFRNQLPAGEQPRQLTIQMQEPRGRSLINVSPKNDALLAAKLNQRWDELISRAVLSDPFALSSTMTVTMGDGSKVVLANLATLTVTPSTIGPTYQYYPISDDQRKTITEPADLPTLAVCNLLATNGTRIHQAVAAWGTSVAISAPTLASNDDILLFIRLPNFQGYPLDQIESGTLVTDLTVVDKIVSVALTLSTGARPSLPNKEVARPLLVLNLGRLSPGLYQAKMTITGLPDANKGKLTIPFSVQ